MFYKKKLVKLLPSNLCLWSADAITASTSFFVCYMVSLNIYKMGQTHA